MPTFSLTLLPYRFVSLRPLELKITGISSPVTENPMCTQNGSSYIMLKSIICKQPASNNPECTFELTVFLLQDTAFLMILIAADISLISYAVKAS